MKAVYRPTVKALRIAAFVCALASVVLFATLASGCAFAPEPPQNGYASGSTDDLELRSIFRQPYMGGSVIYDPDHGDNSQLVPGAAIAVRLGHVQYTGDAVNGHYQDDTSRPAHYGYIKVKKIDSDAIEFAYTWYSSIGSRVTTDHRLKKGGTLDLNYDGIPDLTYAPPPLKRAAMPNAVYLTFLSAKHSRNTSLFSVLPSQYAADEHPNGLLGVNPDGKFVFTMIKQSGYEMVDITDDAVNASHEIHSVMGMQPGDYVLVPSTYDSTMEDVFEDYSVGDPIHQVLVHSGRNDGGYRVVKSGVTLTARTAINKSTHLEEPPSATTTLPTQFAASDFLGMENDAVQKLYAAIPVFAGKPSTGNYLTDLNTMVNSNDLITKIRAAKPDLVFDRETEAQIAEIIIANETSTDDMKRANMFFLSIAFPENCPTFPDMNGQNLAEVHPLFSLNYSAEDNLGGAPIGTPNDKIAVESSMVGGGALYAAASPSYDAKYSEYATKRTAIENTFNKEFAGRFGLDSTSLVGKVNPFITPDAALKIGINCAVSCWWGKLELAAGAAIFIKAEITLGAGGGTINERSIFDLAKNSKPISIFKGTRQFMIGAVILDVEIGQDLDFTISLGANLAASDALFAGFCGLYGAKAAVGVNYGVKWKWGFIPVGITFDPYAKATVYNESANYSGRMYQGSGAVSVITFKATPKLIASQKVILWNTVWVKAANTLSFPASYTCDSAKNPMNKLSIDIDYKLGFSAGLQIDIKIWRKSYAIAEYELIHEQKNIYKKDW